MAINWCRNFTRIQKLGLLVAFTISASSIDLFSKNVDFECIEEKWNDAQAEVV